jgi:hypothetical protein
MEQFMSDAAIYAVEGRDFLPPGPAQRSVSTWWRQEKRAASALLRRHSSAPMLENLDRHVSASAVQPNFGPFVRRLLDIGTVSKPIA